MDVVFYRVLISELVKGLNPILCHVRMLFQRKKDVMNPQSLALSRLKNDMGTQFFNYRAGQYL